MIAQIIYINGPSSSGKTTLAKALQQEFDQPFLHIGIDRVIGIMPEKLNKWIGITAPLSVLFAFFAAIQTPGKVSLNKSLPLQRKIPSCVGRIAILKSNSLGSSVRFLESVRRKLSKTFPYCSLEKFVSHKTRALAIQRLLIL